MPLVGEWVSRAELPELLKQAARIYQGTDMAGQQSQSEFLAKLGPRLNKAFDAHKNDEIKAVGGRGRIPGNITGGVAKLRDIRLAKVEQGKQNAGEWYFYADAVIIEPTHWVDENGNKTKPAGMYTDQFEMLCDTPSKPGAEFKKAREKVEDHLAHVMQLLKRLGCKTEVVPDGQGAMFLWKFVEDLKRVKPHIQFSTNVIKDKTPKPLKEGEERREPFLMQNWEAAIKYEAHVNPDDAVADSTPRGSLPAASSNGDGKKPPTRTAKKAPEPEPEPSADEPTNEEPQEEPQQFDETGVDLDGLARLADGEDGTEEEQIEARATLQTMALKNGIKKPQIINADSWTAVAEMLKGVENCEGGDEETREPAEDEAGFEVGQFVGYQPPQKGIFKKAVAVEITAVNDDNTVDVLTVDSYPNKPGEKKTQRREFKNVPVTALTEGPG
jgi:hypothetical protein